MVVAGCSLNCTISGWNNEQDSAGGQIEIERKQVWMWKHSSQLTTSPHMSRQVAAVHHTCPNNGNFIKNSDLYQMCGRFVNNYHLTCWGTRGSSSQGGNWDFPLFKCQMSRKDRNYIVTLGLPRILIKFQEVE